MKTIAVLLLTAASLLSLVSCETTSSGSSTAGGSATGEGVKPYPLSTCLVTGEPLESKGGSITQVYKGQEVKFCCKPCQLSFKMDPEMFLTKLP